MSRTPSGKSTEGSEGPSRLPPLLRRNDFAAASVMAALSYLTARFTAPTVAAHAAVLLAASFAVIVSGRLGDRLYDSTIMPVLGFTAAQLCFLSRLPFRLLGGGIAFTVVLLAARRAGLAPIRDIPVVDIFLTGAVLSAGYHAVTDAWRFRRGNLRPGPEDSPERNDR